MTELHPSNRWVKLTCYTISDIRGDFSLVQGILEDVLHLAKWDDINQTWKWAIDAVTPGIGSQIGLVLVIMGNFTWPFSYPCLQLDDVKVIRKPWKKSEKITMNMETVLNEQTLVVHAIEELIRTAPEGVLVLTLLGPQEWRLLEQRNKMNEEWANWIDGILLPFAQQHIIAAAQIGPFLFSRGGFNKDWFEDFFFLHHEKSRKQEEKEAETALTDKILKHSLLKSNIKNAGRIITHLNRQLRIWLQNGANTSTKMAKMFASEKSPIFNRQFSRYENMLEYRTIDKVFWRQRLQLPYDPVMVVADTNVNEMRTALDGMFLSPIRHAAAHWIDGTDVVFVQRGMSFSDCASDRLVQGPQVTGLEATFANEKCKDLQFIELAWLGVSVSVDT